ncbi:MAG TPA: hypothetical protein VH561_03760 [Micromonosporaceae bacterium]
MAGSGPAPLPWPAARPAVRHSAGGWALVAVSAVVVVASLCAGLVTAVVPRAADPSASFHAAGQLDTPPAADAPASDWNTWARRAVDEEVGWQAAALVKGDEKAYLAPVDPDDSSLRTELRHRFEVLREMGVGQWTQEVRGRPDVTGELSWHADIRVNYCFGDSTCRLNSLVIGTDWRMDGEQLLLTDVDESAEDQAGPRPWETGELAVATGKRTVVASSPYLKYRLADTLKAAEKAAAVADTLAHWYGPPSRYVIFLAGGSDWSSWYGFSKPEWSAGVYINRTDNEVVINSTVHDPTETLVHELTHVATFAGKDAGRSEATWWLEEGIAEYATMIGKPVSKYDAMAPTRTFVRKSWDGDPAVDRPSDDASLDEAAARYGVAFLAVRRMADLYGQNAMLDFFGAVVHEGTSLDDAAQAVFGKSWKTVSADCASFIRDA